MRTGTSTTDRPAHAFEIRNVNEKIGFQWVMGGEKYQNRLARQLETFYPDSHIEVGELPEPELLPFREEWHMAAARLQLKLQGKKECHVLSRQRPHPCLRDHCSISPLTTVRIVRSGTFTSNRYMLE